jgi:hypothetical protein
VKLRSFEAFTELSGFVKLAAVYWSVRLLVCVISGFPRCSDTWRSHLKGQAVPISPRCLTPQKSKDLMLMACSITCVTVIERAIGISELGVGGAYCCLAVCRVTNCISLAGVFSVKLESHFLCLCCQTPPHDRSVVFSPFLLQAHFRSEEKCFSKSVSTNMYIWKCPLH